MVLINFLANTIPLNKMTTGEISDLYPNLFATRRYDVFHMENYLSFAWSIYNLSIRHFQEKRRSIQQKFNRAPGIFFSISSIANTAWIFAWHYHAIGMSLVLTAVILACLIYINIKIRKANLETLEKLFIKLPFSIYFGWITITAIANTIAFLSSIGWNRFGIPNRCGQA